MVGLADSALAIEDVRMERNRLGRIPSQHDSWSGRAPSLHNTEVTASFVALGAEQGSSCMR